jgi:hypothetical protein
LGDFDLFVSDFDVMIDNEVKTFRLSNYGCFIPNKVSETFKNGQDCYDYFVKEKIEFHSI